MPLIIWLYFSVHEKYKLSERLFKPGLVFFFEIDMCFWNNVFVNAYV